MPSILTMPTVIHHPQLTITSKINRYYACRIFLKGQHQRGINIWSSIINHIKLSKGKKKSNLEVCSEIKIVEERECNSNIQKSAGFVP